MRSSNTCDRHTRGLEPVRAADHDMHPEATLTPLGILDVKSHEFYVIFGTSRDTSDFVVDALEQWWKQRKDRYPHTQRLLINLDNGPAIASNRTQFIRRMIDFVDHHRLTVELAYYPPSHRKYNPVERCWGILENHWNGTLLKSIDVALSWASTMTWRGTRPFVQLWDRVYEKGVRLTRLAFAALHHRLKRSCLLPRFSVVIGPIGNAQPGDG